MPMCRTTVSMTTIVSHMTSYYFLAGQPKGAATGVTGYSSYGVTKGSGKTWGGSGGGGGGAPKYGSSDRCPRCGKQVYIAEKIVSAGSVSVNSHGL